VCSVGDGKRICKSDDATYVSFCPKPKIKSAKNDAPGTLARIRNKGSRSSSAPHQARTRGLQPIAGGCIRAAASVSTARRKGCSTKTTPLAEVTSAAWSKAAEERVGVKLHRRNSPTFSQYHSVARFIVPHSLHFERLLSGGVLARREMRRVLRSSG